ncbi:MAG: DUF2971 domain-containing protein [Amaricoccus sp.]
MERVEGLSGERGREMRLFLPSLDARVAEARASGLRFAHYTAAPAAMSMVRNRELWLRNTQCMNDSSEVRHGLELLGRAYRGAHGARLMGFLESIWPGFRQRAGERIEALAHSVAHDTYIGCVSEHDPAEDGVGRLSMWRAYSAIGGVAFVLRNGPLVGPGSDALAVFTGPVEYAGREEFFARFGRFVDGLLGEGAYLEGIGEERACRGLVGSYHFAALSTKHPGFAEEREWRMAFTPALQPQRDLVRAVELCRGQPQLVYKLPLAWRDGDDGASTALADVLDALIIGPSESPQAMRAAFVELLGQAGVADPEAVVRVSEIPVR